MDKLDFIKINNYCFPKDIKVKSRECVWYTHMNIFRIYVIYIPKKIYEYPISMSVAREIKIQPIMQYRTCSLECLKLKRAAISNVDKDGRATRTFLHCCWVYKMVYSGELFVILL